MDAIRPRGCETMKPLAIDLYCGLGGWTDGLIAEGWDVIGFDIEAHAYDGQRYQGQLVIQDVLTLHGAQFRDADLIVGSSPCTDYSYMAMPWSRAKAKAAAIREDESGEALKRLNALFDAQFRIQRQASEAAGRHIPMVVENVKGAEPWVGRASWNFGSYYLWGDIPALMPQAISGRKNPGFRFDGSGKSFQTESVQRHLLAGRKHEGGAWFKDNRRPDGGEKRVRDAVASCSSGSKKRKAASAMIAKIPFDLSSHIGRVYHPGVGAAVNASTRTAPDRRHEDERRP